MTKDSDVVALAKALIACPSVTPHTAGVFDVLEDFLTPLGFKVIRHTFHEDGYEPVENIYLRYGDEGPNFCFAGHTDVVPAGDEAAWTIPPFKPEVMHGELYGRGAEDMKGAIAAFMIAARDFLEANKFRGSISLLITQDEEDVAVNGTKKMLEFIAEKGEKIDVCVVGEPTNPDKIGQMAKVGRRGSALYTLIVQGTQGHVAYPERADNPVTRLVNMLHALKNARLDNGSDFFPPSNLEVTSIDVGNPTVNMIPAKATAKISVRFNDQLTGADVTKRVHELVAPFGAYVLESRISGESFLTTHEGLTQVVVEAVRDVVGEAPECSTTGGTSDARFIKDYCPVIEFGTTGRTAHKVDERVEVTTLETLVKIYGRMLVRYFSQ